MCITYAGVSNMQKRVDSFLRERISTKRNDMSALSGNRLLQDLQIHGSPGEKK